MFAIRTSGFSVYDIGRHFLSKNVTPTLKRYSCELYGSILMTFGRNI